jgi:hypothetical protein
VFGFGSVPLRRWFGRKNCHELSLSELTDARAIG